MPVLILIAGLPGSGKSTIARVLSAQRGALHLNSDLLRRELGLMGHYHPDHKAKVYAHLVEKTKAALSAGQDVIADSTFSKESVRKPFRDIAAVSRAPLVWVEVRAAESTIRERLKTPRPDSEADFEVYEKIRDEADPFAEPHLVVWSDEADMNTIIAAINEYIASHVAE